MRLAAWFVGGAVAAVLVWLALAPTWAQPLFARQNFRERTVPTAGGVAAVMAVLVVAAIMAMARRGGLRPEVSSAVLVATGFGLLGTIDDLAGDNERKGFRGHLLALARGRLTTGGLKLFGGLAVAACALGVLGRNVSPVDVAIVAAAANLGNLFDRAPGRVAKVACLAFAALVLAGPAGLAGVALVVGAITGLAGFDLRERLMLGDAGANAVGAALGIGAVITADRGIPSVSILGILVGLNLLSEWVSFSRVIGAVAPLRWLDGLGRVKVAR